MNNIASSSVTKNLKVRQCPTMLHCIFSEWHGIRASIFMLIFLFHSPLRAQDYTQTQDRIKSIYVYNFVKDVKWPDEKSSEVMKICLLQKNGFYTELEKLVQAKKVNGRSISVQLASVQDCRQCDLLFIEEEQAVTKFKRDEDCNSLIVTYGFYEKSISNIVLMFQNNKLQFSINAPLCDKLGFKISSHLSSLANNSLITL